MPVKGVAIDLVRARLPQILGQARDQLGRLSLKPPGWRARATATRWIDRRIVLAALLLGGILHICFTFWASIFTGGHAYRQLVEQLPVNRMTVLPQQAPSKQILPELPPDMLYAVCRFDLHQGAVAVRATVLGPGWALSVHTPHGTNIYVLTGQPTRSTDVSFLLISNAPDAVHSMPRRESAAETPIVSPTLEGVVVLRAPVRGLAWAAETEAMLQRASCALVKQ
jgi:uncharacterized membrane protein